MEFKTESLFLTTSYNLKVSNLYLTILYKTILCPWFLALYLISVFRSLSLNLISYEPSEDKSYSSFGIEY